LALICGDDGLRFCDFFSHCNWDFICGLVFIMLDWFMQILCCG